MSDDRGANFDAIDEAAHLAREREIARLEGNVTPFRHPDVPEPRVKLAETDLNDDHVATVLAGRVRGRMLHCWAWNAWLAWDGTRYAKDDGERIQAEALEAARELASLAASQAAEAESGKEARTLITFARSVRTKRVLDAAVSLARSAPELPVSVDELDSDPYIINCQNGVLDLQKERLRPHSPRQRHTKVTGAKWDRAADCPRWRQFLDEVTGGDQELQDFLQVASGYSLTGSVREQCFFLLHGDGANGKSVFLETVRHVAGDYGQSTPFETFLARYGEGVPNDLARLQGVRFASAVEADAGRRFAEARLKAFVGGDRVTARFMRAEYFEFNPTAKLWLACNDKPRVAGTDEGIWRRIRLVPFTVTIPPEKRDGDLVAKLRAESDGILAWAIEGALIWRDHGLPTPAAVREATDEYRSESDLIGQFISDACDTGSGCRVAGAEIFKAFRSWLEDQGVRQRISSQRFGRELTKKGYEVEATRSGKVRIGLQPRQP